MPDLLTQPEATDLVTSYMKAEGPVTSTQALLDSGAVPRLKGYTVRPGKVSDSIFGGKFSYKGQEYENPPLQTKEGVPLRIMVRTDRISTHDISRGSIPFKDQLLAGNHNYMRRQLTEVLGTSQIDVPGLEDTSVVIAAENLRQIPVEMVLRAYAAKSTTSTSLFQAYFVRNQREFSGHTLPEDLAINGPLPEVLDTPSTKSETNDVTISPQWLFDHGFCTPPQYEKMSKAAFAAFDIVSKFLGQRGLILVDTKTEHGINRHGKIVSQDELYTMDSSRFWRRDDFDAQKTFFLAGDEATLVSYLKRTQPGIKEKDYMHDGKVHMSPLSLSKEFARGFSEGEKGYTDEQRLQIAVRYIIGGQELLGVRFVPDRRPRDERVVKGLEAVLSQLVA